MKKTKALALILTSTLLGVNANAQLYPYQNKSLSFHERAKNLVSLLTLEEKINQIGHQTLSISRDGINLPGYDYWNEALHGVARSGLATSFPSSKGMSATWNRQLIYDCAWATSDEARVYNNKSRKGLIYWCPTINMSRDPRWGRDEENYGEDPYLTAELAIQYVRGMQGDDGKAHKYYKTIATAKHFAANNYEKGRHNTSSDVNDFNLREYYLPAFERVVKEANVRSIMSAYNSLNGVPCGANGILLNSILRDEWGFNGFVTSDCGAVDDVFQRHKFVSTGAEASGISIANGEDLNCGSTFQSHCLEAINKGYMTEAQLDTALTRVLEARFSVGEFDSKADVEWRGTADSLLNRTAHQQLALKAARESIVLLKNSNDFLPLSKSKTIAVIGPLGNTIMLGGYSGSPNKLTTPLQGIAEKLNVTVSDGSIQFEDNDGQSTESNNNRLAHEANGSAGNIGYIHNGDWLSYNNVNFGAGVSKLEVCSGAQNSNPTVMSVYLDKIDSTPEVTITLQPTGNWGKYTSTIVDVDPTVFNGTHTVYTKFTFSGNRYGANMDWFKFYNPSAPDPLQSKGPLYFVKGCNITGNVNLDIESAKAIAKKADIVILALGTSLDVSDEGHDRSSLTLPGNQEKLMKEVFSVNQNIVLLLETCSSVDITWAKQNVPAIIEAWYGGQAQGKAIADVLYGDYNPSGKLTSTWYAALSDLPSDMQKYNIEEAKYTYMFYDKEPLYPFGYGLSYTNFSYSDLNIAPSGIKKGETATISFKIKNTGKKSGAEIPQLYIHTNGTLGGQKMQLKGFDKVELRPGEEKTIKLTLPYEQLAHFNSAVGAKTFDVEKGVVDIMVGASSADIRLRGSLNVEETATVEYTYQHADPTGIQAVECQKMNTGNKVYNQNGIVVGTTENFEQLPKGFYIANGYKILKQLR